MTMRTGVSTFSQEGRLWIVLTRFHAATMKIHIPYPFIVSLLALLLMACGDFGYQDLDSPDGTPTRWSVHGSSNISENPLFPVTKLNRLSNPRLALVWWLNYPYHQEFLVESLEGETQNQAPYHFHARYRNSEKTWPRLVSPLAKLVLFQDQDQDGELSAFEFPAAEQLWIDSLHSMAIELENELDTIRLFSQPCPEQTYATLWLTRDSIHLKIGNSLSSVVLSPRDLSLYDYWNSAQYVLLDPSGWTYLLASRNRDQLFSNQDTAVKFPIARCPNSTHARIWASHLGNAILKGVSYKRHSLQYDWESSNYGWRDARMNSSSNKDWIAGMSIDDYFLFLESENKKKQTGAALSGSAFSIEGWESVPLGWIHLKCIKTRCSIREDSVKIHLGDRWTDLQPPSNATPIQTTDSIAVTKETARSLSGKYLLTGTDAEVEIVHIENTNWISFPEMHYSRLSWKNLGYLRLVPYLDPIGDTVFTLAANPKVSIRPHPRENAFVNKVDILFSGWRTVATRKESAVDTVVQSLKTLSSLWKSNMDGPAVPENGWQALHSDGKTTLIMTPNGPRSASIRIPEWNMEQSSLIAAGESSWVSQDLLLTVTPMLNEKGQWIGATVCLLHGCTLFDAPYESTSLVRSSSVPSIGYRPGLEHPLPAATVELSQPGLQRWHQKFPEAHSMWRYEIRSASTDTAMIWITLWQKRSNGSLKLLESPFLWKAIPGEPLPLDPILPNENPLQLVIQLVSAKEGQNLPSAFQIEARAK